MSLDVTLTNNSCPHCGSGDDVFHANITHNLNKMAEALGVYELVWRPEETGIKDASGLIAPLKTAIAKMKRYPKKHKKYDSPNGWGTYDNFLPWLEKYLKACEEYPYATVKVSR